MLKSVNPATGVLVAEHPPMNAQAVDAALDRATTAWHKWRLTPLADRAALVARLSDVYGANRERLAKMITQEMGKTYASALAEVDKSVGGLRYYAEHGPAMLEVRRQRLANGAWAEMHWLPIGPVLAVMPWNYPYWQVVRFLAPALVAGNVGLLKHAANVQGCAELMVEMMAEAGAPEGLFQNLAIRAADVAPVIADPRVAAVTLTGSEGAGRKVAAQAGDALKKVVLELGGSDPFIVMPSADLDAAVDAAVVARTQNAGQACICGKRMIIHADVYDDFAQRFATALAALRIGDPMDSETQMGPLSSVAQRDSVLEQVEQARAEGAEVIGAEAIDGPGAFMRAGLLTGLSPQSPLMAEEIFGPVAMLFKASDLADAIRIANAIPYGLGSSFWSRNADEIQIAIRDIEAGMTSINQITVSAPEVPFGGVKRSGYGRELADAGMHEFMNLKTVLLPN